MKRISDDEYLVELKAPAKKGKANTALVKLLSKHFGRGVRIVGGLTSRDKIVEIEEAASSFEM